MSTHRGVVKGFNRLRGIVCSLFYNLRKGNTEYLGINTTNLEKLIFRTLLESHIFEGSVAFNPHHRVLLVYGRLVADYATLLEEPRSHSWDVRLQFCDKGHITCHVKLGDHPSKVVPVCTSSIPTNLRHVLKRLVPILYHANL